MLRVAQMARLLLDFNEHYIYSQNLAKLKHPKIMFRFQQQQESNTKVPDTISFEQKDSIHNGTDECTTTSSSTAGSFSSDELQALNTALCFLASINADIAEIHAFLIAHPHALLLEGVGQMPEESAHAIVTQQLQRCRCFATTCQENRMQVLSALDRGFAHYESLRWGQKGQTSRSIPADYLEELIKLEQQIRNWRHEELVLRHRLIETVGEVRNYRDELNHVNTQNRRPLLLCTARSDVFAKRSSLEYRVGLASLNLSCVEREHGELLKQIRQGRQVQFAVLKRVFADCRRHVCIGHKASFPQTKKSSQATG